MGDYSIVALGIAIALVLFALGYLLSSSAINRTITRPGRPIDENKIEDSQR